MPLCATAHDRFYTMKVLILDMDLWALPLTGTTDYILVRMVERGGAASRKDETVG